MKSPIMGKGPSAPSTGGPRFFASTNVQEPSSTFVRSVACVILATAVAKLYSATGAAKILEMPNDLFPITMRQTLWAVAVVELLVAVFVLLSRNITAKLVSILWLSGNFGLYRLAMAVVAPGSTCPCLGSLTEKLHLKQSTADHLLVGLVVYMLFGSVFFLVTGRDQKEPLDPEAGGCHTAPTAV